MKVQMLTLLLLYLAASTHTLPGPAAEQHEWRQWKTKYNKVYTDPSQEANAHARWSRHRRLVQSHNSRADVTFTLELNGFADQERTEEKLKNILSQESRRETNGRSFHSLRFVPDVKTNIQSPAPPESFDWRTKGAISHVKNRIGGDTDAFVVTEEVESFHFIRTGRLVGVSTKEIIDCCSDGAGMLVPNIYECIAQHGGLCSDYPSHGGSHVCRNDSCKAVAKDAKVTMHVSKGNESEMVFAVLKCPLAVQVDASNLSFHLYKSGVYFDSWCSHRRNHSLQLVGYGVDNGEPYWILKNSWGVDWGIDGYMWMKRGVNTCGVAEFVIYPQ